ncbi:MAG TPA: sigma 54-interacting transcriptional regulator [Planctomycetota bacterium]|nr:sigma 54-interacting transcriptional regulator [Planctomycetota bacterium]
MDLEKGLELLEQIAARFAEGADLGQAASTLVDLALAAYPARSAFVARADTEAGLALRWLHGREREGKVQDPQQQGRLLYRVESALREMSAGVLETPPPAMTGGAAPEGAIPVKADAGNPPLHCFPLLEGAEPTSAVLGVIGLVPDPVALGDASQLAGRAFRIGRDLARARLHADLEKERGKVLIAAALGTPLEQAPSEPIDEGEPGGDPRGFRYRYDEIVTRSPRMYEVFKKLDKVIHLEAPVLIYGETGTGKELIARAIHRNSPRRKRKFYAQNFGAFAESLLESELFGHVKGAFTGADKDRKGLFEIASGSTLFLDEIGEMNFDLQKKLLRVLQEHEVVPLGSTVPIKVDVRIVCATNRNLKKEVEAGHFREDLYHRLDVVKIDLPALHERPEDVPHLIEHFLRKIARERGEKPKVLDRRDPRILKTLVEHKWPGNIRQLENLVKRLAYLSNELITWDVLVEHGQLVQEGPKQQAEAARPVRALDDVVEEVEREEITNALKQTAGNRTRAAALLKINRRSLLRRLKKYGLASAEDEEALASDEGEI